MTATDFAAVLDDARVRVETTLKKIIATLPDSEVSSAMEYSLMSGGKRLRPALVYRTAALFGRDDDNIDRIAAAIEMIHTYSLIHDDLPCMDNDDFRRGQPSCHKRFGEANAVLAGDALLNLAAETLLGGEYSPSYFKAAAYVFECSGIFGMVGGQAVDISRDKTGDFDTVDFLTKNKTSKLMMASVGSACLCCGGGDNEFAALVKFAEYFGKSFQAADDLLDRAKSGETSYVTALGVRGTKNLMAEYDNLARESLEIFGEKADFFRQLCIFNRSREI